MSEDADHLLRRVGLRIQKRRQEIGWTQQQLANELEMDQSSLAKIEQGKQNLTVRTLAKLANVLGVKVADLFAEEKPQLAPYPPAPFPRFRGKGGPCPEALGKQRSEGAGVATVSFLISADAPSDPRKETVAKPVRCSVARLGVREKTPLSPRTGGKGPGDRGQTLGCVTPRQARRA